MFSLLTIFLWIISTFAEVYFTEEFDYTWRSRWVEGKYYEKDGLQGKWGWQIPLYYNKKELDFCLSTIEDKKYYQISCDMGKTFSTKDKDLIVAFTVKNQEETRFAGGYLKLFPEGIDQEQLNTQTPFYLMFGPDWNGKLNNMLRVLIRYNNRNFELRSHHACPPDKNTYLYTFIIHPDWTYEIHLNDQLERKAPMEEEFDFVRPRLIPDPNAKKPDDWEDEMEIYDPSDRKPADWDQPMVVDDPTDVKPEDWNETTMGEWKPRRIANPLYKGTWYPRIIPNPKYKGPWEPPLVPNPLFEKEKETYHFSKVRYVGFDVYQEKCGTLFDKIFIGDDWAEYRAYLAVTWDPFHRAEVEGEKKKSGSADVRDAKPMGVANLNSRQEREKRRKEEEDRMIERKRKELEEEARRKKLLEEEEEEEEEEFEEDEDDEEEIDVDEEISTKKDKGTTKKGKSDEKYEL
ncbi:putative Calreticulin CRP55 [Monocercomonoides exilis]|uniref:putative Calreticulin CRP55 n=1 Tax=Monocercomonoides exilis TaxID=2049356 RepID=UPI0035596293|nr:putative Calreticulin CRP55 [Monocercomonoides exilis]